MFHKRKYVPVNKHKYVGDYNNIVMRSSWETKFALWCDLNDSVLKWQSEETIIPYICPTDNRAHRYFVDFKIQVRNKDGKVCTYLVEIKPEIQTIPPKPPERKTKRFISEVMTYGKNQAKWKAADEYAKDRGWSFIVLTEKHLGIK